MTKYMWLSTWVCQYEVIRLGCVHAWTLVEWETLTLGYSYTIIYGRCRIIPHGTNTSDAILFPKITVSKSNTEGNNNPSAALTYSVSEIDVSSKPWPQYDWQFQRRNSNQCAHQSLIIYEVMPRVLFAYFTIKKQDPSVSMYLSKQDRWRPSCLGLQEQAFHVHARHMWGKQLDSSMLQ